MNCLVWCDQVGQLALPVSGLLDGAGDRSRPCQRGRQSHGVVIVGQRATVQRGESLEFAERWGSCQLSRLNRASSACHSRAQP